jgi:cobalt-zinc-cadmium efflux system outer membrane protein
MSRTVLCAALACVIGLTAGAPAGAAPPAVQALEDAEGNEPKAVTLDLHGALALAKKTGPVAVTARARTTEARSRRVGAGVYPTENPVIDFFAGPAISDADLGFKLGAGIFQSFDLGHRVRARLDAVDAAVEEAEAGAAVMEQSLMREVGEAYLRALWAEARLKYAVDLEKVATDVSRATERRAKAGDATALEVNVATGALARASADVKAYEAAREAEVGRLKTLLGLAHETQIELAGDLEKGRRIDGRTLITGAGKRPELRALQAELKGAQAEIDLGDALAAPELGVGARYERDEDNVHSVFGTLSLTLPIFEYGQGVSAAARARATRVETQIRLGKRQVDNEVRTALGVYERRAGAAEVFEQGGGRKAFEDNLRLATKGYEAGETSLSELILIRRELIDTEIGRLDRLLEVRLAELDVLLAAGALP